jgi:RNA polymerase sigma-70 factor, ECF subfamily
VKRSPDDSSDDALIRRLGRGDEGAFDPLYDRHAGWVFGLARRLGGGDEDCAADVLQETFGWLVARAPDIELRVPMRSMLYPVVRHSVLTWKRRSRRDPGLEMPESILDRREGPERADLADLAEILRALDEAHREVVLLRYLEEMELREIAAALDLPLGTVKSRLHHALARIRAHPRAGAYFEEKNDEV